MSNAKKSRKQRVRENKKYKFGSLGKAIYNLLESKGIDNVSYEESLKLAKSIMPHTNYDKSHFAWYKSKLRKRLNS
jgi:hypothetical protein